MPVHTQVSPEEDASSVENPPPFARGATPAPAAGPSLAKPALPSSGPGAGSGDGGTPSGGWSTPPAGAPPNPATMAQAPVATRAPGAPNSLVCAVVSFFFPGVGQILAGQLLKGLVLLGLTVFTCGGFGLLPFIAAADAYMIAERRGRGETVGDWQFF